MAQSKLDLIIRTRKTGQGEKQAQTGLKGITQSFGDLKGVIAAGVLGVGAKQIIDFGKAAIDAASDVQEMQSKFSVVFGRETPRATQALEDFADAANRDKYALMEMAASVQDTFVPLGFARDKAADLSLSLVELASDVASFNNASDPDVMRDFQSAIVGNHETVRKYGIVITESTLKQELMKMGAEDLTGAALEQAKVQARLNLIYAGTTDAQGDAIRTSQSFANVSRGLEGQLHELQVTIGELALPEVTADMAGLVQVMKDPAIEKLIKSIHEINTFLMAAKNPLEMYDYLMRQGQYAVEDNTDAVEEYTDSEERRLQVIESGNSIARAQAASTAWTTDEIRKQRQAMEAAYGPGRDWADLAYDSAEGAEAAAKANAQFADEMQAAKDAAAAANPPVTELLDSLDRQIASPLTAFIKDLEWMMATGGRFEEAFAAIKEGLASGEITPEQAKSLTGELLVAVQDVQTELGEISADDAAQNISDTLGISLEDAKALIAGSDGIQGALNRLTSTEYHIQVYVDYVDNGAIGRGQVGSQGRLGGEKKAAGGPVDRDVAYLVGEQGPELFVPRTSGEIIPNNRLAGQQINVSEGAVVVQLANADPGAAYRAGKQAGIGLLETLRSRGID